MFSFLFLLILNPLDYSAFVQISNLLLTQTKIRKEKRKKKEGAQKRNIKIDNNMKKETDGRHKWPLPPAQMKTLTIIKYGQLI